MTVHPSAASRDGPALLHLIVRRRQAQGHPFWPRRPSGGGTQEAPKTHPTDAQMELWVSRGAAGMHRMGWTSCPQTGRGFLPAQPAGASTPVGIPGVRWSARAGPADP